MQTSKRGGSALFGERALDGGERLECENRIDRLCRSPPFVEQQPDGKVKGSLSALGDASKPSRYDFLLRRGRARPERVRTRVQRSRLA